MATKTLLWHFWRLALAAILLWWDIRLFWFYAFTILLLAIHTINHLRAVVRILSLSHDSKLIAIYERAGITHKDVGEVLERTTLALSLEHKKTLDEDWRLASGDWTSRW